MGLRAYIFGHNERLYYVISTLSTFFFDDEMENYHFSAEKVFTRIRKKIFLEKFRLFYVIKIKLRENRTDCKFTLNSSFVNKKISSNTKRIEIECFIRPNDQLIRVANL